MRPARSVMTMALAAAFRAALCRRYCACLCSVMAAPEPDVPAMCPARSGVGSGRPRWAGDKTPSMTGEPSIRADYLNARRDAAKLCGRPGLEDGSDEQQHSCPDTL